MCRPKTPMHSQHTLTTTPTVQTILILCAHNAHKKTFYTGKGSKSKSHFHRNAIITPGTPKSRIVHRNGILTPGTSKSHNVHRNGDIYTGNMKSQNMLCGLIKHCDVVKRCTRCCKKVKRMYSLLKKGETNVRFVDK